MRSLVFSALLLASLTTSRLATADPAPKPTPLQAAIIDAVHDGDADALASHLAVPFTWSLIPPQDNCADYNSGHGVVRKRAELVKMAACLLKVNHRISYHVEFGPLPKGAPRDGTIVFFIPKGGHAATGLAFGVDHAGEDHLLPHEHGN
jgi:hypothetical protein